MIVQIISGFVINYLYDENRVSKPWYDYVHHWFGRILSLFALVNIILGLRMFEVSFVFYVLLAAHLVFLGGLAWFLNRVFKEIPDDKNV